MIIAEDLSDGEDLWASQAICGIPWATLKSFWSKVTKGWILKNAISGTIQIYFVLVIIHGVMKAKWLRRIEDIDLLSHWLMTSLWTTLHRAGVRNVGDDGLPRIW